MKTHPLLIDVHQAGRLLNMLPARVTRLTKRGELPSVILPDGELRYSPDDLKEWVDAYRRSPESEGGAHA